MEESAGDEVPRPIFRDIRRYICDYCGICRSKKSLITSHIQTHHKEEEEDEEVGGRKSNVCEQCGASFKKPAYLLQHMQSHSLERPYVCSVDDCHASYRRKDHLTRHSLKHEGKLFKCPIENCSCEFMVKGNVNRHVKELHNENPPLNDTGPKQHVCQEPGCGKVFKYLSKLQTHRDSHVKPDVVEAFCAEPGCMKHFSNSECLKAHINSCHRYMNCEICGAKQLRKNIKRHLRMHEACAGSTKRVKCHFEDCSHTFSNKTNLLKHVRAVHLEATPFACGFTGCGMRFAYKHVRDKHEKSGVHIFTPVKHLEHDREMRTKSRGGRKRECPTVETLIRKRVIPPTNMEEYQSWLCGMENQDQS
ncbi:transcription factor IIIA-like [Euphorbia lathyris]|uniref:transcription factor IIIA-like n=1 Tax=Euphorbia lathyris TaxID=212925 RepID=UPI0033143112